MIGAMLQILTDVLCNLSNVIIILFIIILGFFFVYMVIKITVFEASPNISWLVILALLCAPLVLCTSEECQLVYIKQRFKKNNTEFSRPPCFCDNTTIIARMKENIKLQNATGSYYLLEGPHGSGKTTVLLSAVEAIGNNIVYVSVSQDRDFGLTFANGLSIDLGCSPSIIDGIIYLLGVRNKTCPETLEEKVEVCLDLLEKAMQQIKKGGNPAPILIIDHVNLLLDRSTEKTKVVVNLQDFAKRMADERLLTIYFGSSEGKVHHLFHQQSNGSQLVPYPHRAWDLPYEEAEKYLGCLCPLASHDINITEIINIVGGHFGHIISACAILELKRGSKTSVDLVEVKNELFETVVGELESLGISKTPTSKAQDNVTWTLAKSILVATNNTIDLREADAMLENLSVDDYNKLTGASIFYFNWIGQKVAIYSTLVHSYFKDVIGREKLIDSQPLD